MISPKVTKDDQQNDKKLGQKHNQRSGTGLSQTGPRFPLLIVAEDNFIQINLNVLDQSSVFNHIELEELI